jgi:hypothetical protein
VDGIFAIHSGKQPSILASTSAKDGLSEWLWELVIKSLPRMDGGETWRGAGMGGANALYPGLVPSPLENMEG